MQEIIVDNTVFVIAPYGRIYALQMWFQQHGLLLSGKL